MTVNTPGPWHTRESKVNIGYVDVVDATGNWICETAFMSDAELIAAAPDLRYALNLVWGALEETENGPSFSTREIQIIENAINKVKGK